MADPDMLFDLNLKDAELVDALSDFFARTGRAFVIDDSVAGTISLRSSDLGFHDALKLMLPDGYEAVEVGEIYHIRRVPQATPRRAA